MHSLSGKRLLLVGFIVVLLIAIPLTLYLLKQQSDNRSRATPSTDITFSPSSTSASPINKNVGDSIPLDVRVAPGVNLVSYVRIEIQYDATKLQPSGANAFVPNKTAFPTILQGPTYSNGKIDVTLSTGSDPTSALQAEASAGIVTFNALAPTDVGSPTQVTFTDKPTTEVLSVGATDQSSENVLSTTSPAFIAINGPAATGTPSPTATPGPTAIPVPGQPTATPGPTAEPAVTATPSATIIPTAIPPVIINVTNTPIPTIAQTGSTGVTFGVGALLTTVTVIGGILFFAL